MPTPDKTVAPRVFFGDIVYPQTVQSGDGTITASSGIVHITKGSAAAITLTPPTAGTDDGKTLEIISETAFAHVVTCSDGFNAKGSSGTATFGAAKGNGLVLVARNGHWWTMGGQTGVTLA